MLDLAGDWPSPPQPCINLDYVSPLVESMRGDEECETLVASISDNLFDVDTLHAQIVEWVTHGFPLNHDNTMRGKHHACNYKSSVNEYKPHVTKSLLKRLNCC